MVTFDNGTLIFLNSFTGIMMSIIIVIYALKSPYLRGIWYLAAGNLIRAAGFLLLLYQGTLPVILSIITANTLLALGSIGIAAMVTSLLKRKFPILFFSILAVLNLSLFIYFTYVDFSTPIRIIAVSATFMFTYGYIAMVIFNSTRKKISLSITVYGGFFAFLSLFYLARCILVFFIGWVTSIMESDPLTGATVLVAYAATIGWSFGYFLLTSSTLQRDLENTVDELSSANSDRDKIISIIGHDLRSPLASCAHLVDDVLTDKKMDSSTTLTFLREIRNTLSKFSNMLENLLDWGRSQRGIINLHPSVIILKETVLEISRHFTDSVKTKEIDMQVSVEKGILLEVDRRSLEVVLRNLIANAVKFTPPGGSISINGRRADSRVAVSIRDSGVGMSRELIEKILGNQAVQSTTGTSQEKGTGLGLALCRDFITRNQWEWDISSKISEGSDFTVLIPGVVSGIS